MNKKEAQAQILQKYDEPIIRLYLKILNEEKDIMKKTDLKKRIAELILKEVKANDN